jgi:hypothetical protein
VKRNGSTFLFLEIGSLPEGIGPSGLKMHGSLRADQAGDGDKEMEIERAGRKNLNPLAAE